ncbi:GTPase domain-containing protein [Georgenia deserti]|uniref:GTPase n=1 Tax=Georgenia deserti TaxID=2093781 RepID=A0ABW4LAY3_9MICO
MTTPAHVAASPEPAGAARHPRLAVVTHLERDVDEVGFPLDIPGADGLRALRERILTQIGARLLPRLKDEAAPAVVVLGGSTGVGKSTLVNSLLGDDVTEASVLRPTTRNPIVAIHPQDLPLVEGRPITELADVVTHDDVPAGLALLDAPDLNSVDARNRSLANQLLETADLWVFVTSASRYGDALPWQLLGEAHSRGITTAVVLNRVPSEVLAQVRKDLMGRLDGLGLGSAPLFVISDAGPHEGPLDRAAVAELAAWLRLVSDRHRGAGVVRRTNRGIWAGLREELARLADGADAQVDAVSALRRRAEEAAEEPAKELRKALADGRAGLGAPTTRWLSLASSGGPLAPLVRRRVLPSLLPGRVQEAREKAAAALADETAAAVRLLVADALRRAAAGVRQAWSDPDLGAERLMAAVAENGGADATARDVVDGWRAAVRDQVGDGDRTLRGGGLAALVQTGAAGVAGAADAAARLAPGAVAQAREDLLDRAEAAVRAVLDPYLTQLEDLPVQPGTALRLRATELKEHA